MIEFTSIEALIMAYAPMVVTIIGVIVAFLRMVAVIKELKSDSKKTNEEKSAEIQELKNQMSDVLKTNAQLRAQISELLTKIDYKKR